MRHPNKLHSGKRPCQGVCSQKHQSICDETRIPLNRNKKGAHKGRPIETEGPTSKIKFGDAGDGVPTKIWDTPRYQTN
jgi:hypothetical protein